MSQHTIQVTGVNHANGKYTVSVNGAQGAQEFEISETNILGSLTPLPEMDDEAVLQLELEQIAQTDPAFETLDSLAGKTLTATSASVVVS